MELEIYKLQYPTNVSIAGNNQYSLALGFFDGLHKGHFEVIQQAKKKAEELNIQSAVMTFDPHPSHVLGDGKNKVGYITPFEEKCRLLRLMGIDALFVVTFNPQLAALTPAEFVEIFIKRLNVKHVTAGFDYTFGTKGSGTMEEMENLSDGLFGTTVVGKVIDDAQKVSSTRIRQLLANGNVEEAASLLGRNFRTIGTVVHGAKNGRKLGFPTANVQPADSSILPANGVYAVRFSFDDVTHDGVCNVGIKPTFNDPNVKEAMVEVHVLNFEGDLYGKEVAVDWIAHIREEKKFESFDALIAQIGRDKQLAESILAKTH